MEKYTKEKFIEKAKEVHGNKYDYSKVNYVNSSTKVCIICPEHGEFWQTPNSHLNGSGCPECSGLKKWDTEKFIKKAREVHGNRYDYSEAVYVNKRTPVTIICPIHGKFVQNPHNHVSQKQGCPLCGKKYAIEWRKNDYRSFVDESIKRFGNIYEFPNIENEYENSHSKIHIKCKKCGSIFEKIACDHITSPHGGCLKCYANKSTGEEEIGEFISRLVGKENVVFSSRAVLPNTELDIYIPCKKISIEYNGIYWHSSAMKHKNYHLFKTEACESRGIKLIQIFEDEYVNHKDIVLSKLKHILHKSEGERIWARKCTIEEISRAEAKSFLDNNHIQGFAYSTIYIGAYHEGTLIAVMTFIRRKNEWELNRCCTDINKICSGVVSKMFSYFVKNYNPSIIKSFADRRWTSHFGNNVYLKMGFSEEKILAPDYRYVITKRGNIERAHKFGFRKKILNKKYGLDNSLTETEMIKKLSIPKIYDCGLIKYIWKKRN